VPITPFATTLEIATAIAIPIRSAIYSLKTYIDSNSGEIQLLLSCNFYVHVRNVLIWLTCVIESIPALDLHCILCVASNTR